MVDLTAERLRFRLGYDPETGVFRWKEHRIAELVGTVAGTVAGRYRRIMLDGKRYQATALAWLYVHGEWPSSEIDHRDLDTTNDAISNLRCASHAENSANRSRRSDNTSGYKGVSFRRGMFVARITRLGKTISLGSYSTAEAAHAAYRAAAQRLHGEFARAA